MGRLRAAVAHNLRRLRQFLRARPLRIASGVLFVASALGVGGSVVRLRRYVQESPRFCETCHEVSPEIAVWVESKHRTVRCQSCHHNTLSDGLRILMATVSGEVEDIRHAEVDLTSCAGCHTSHDARWPDIASSRGHLIHANQEAIACTRCHGAQMHFDQPPREGCIECHVGHALGDSHGDRHCLACHNFLTTEDVIKPTRSDCMQCHRHNERPVLIPADAPMQLRCSACHQPHRDQKIVPCAACHASPELVGSHHVPGHAKCGDCHTAHSWTSTRAQCLHCHRVGPAHHKEQACTRCHAFKKGLTRAP